MTKFLTAILLMFLVIADIQTVLAQGEPPWRRPLKTCTGTDGRNFSNITTFQDSAGVPNLLMLSSGVIIAVFQWFRQPVGSPSWDRVAVKFSSDSGTSWTLPQPVSITGLPQNHQRPFDPTLTQTDDGRIRMYFSSGLNLTLDTSVGTYSAVSTDGINYSADPGVRFTLPGRAIIDPAVVKFNGLWHLINPGPPGTAYHNISADGLNFTRVNDIVAAQSYTWIGNFLNNSSNELRFYGSGSMAWYASSSNGGEWFGYQFTNIQGGDPSVLKLSASSYLMIYTGMPYPSSVSEYQAIESESSLTNYPNPFNPATSISFVAPISFGDVRKLFVFSITDATGKVLENHSTFLKAGDSYHFEFNANDLAAGVYFCTVSTDGVMLNAIRMALIK